MRGEQSNEYTIAFNEPGPSPHAWGSACTTEVLTVAKITADTTMSVVGYISRHL
ncbi:hypothetical protein B005_2177 [Nocardiopsis alba ATCC BAA-2165]|uniref:Uncharacterized protein n=1 Tax=Nocardiopsis alba (strain ATCC BAA-2165 / BE74) TaxID=1205910 RepID=J7LGT1_NOCAA|nr:hypothetical protein B005_2177 [Nocardiopsis alba ATCC BAA-2165]